MRCNSNEGNYESHINYEIKKNEAERDYGLICELLCRCSEDQYSLMDQALLLNGALEIAERYNLDNDVQFGIKEKIIAVEKAYLDSIGIKQIDPEKLDDDFEQTKKHKDALASLRDDMKSRLDSLDGVSVGRNYVSKISELYEKIAFEIEGFIKNLVDQCQEIIGPLPLGIREDQYSFMSLGSLSSFAATPYSDLEFMVVLSDDLTDQQEEKAKEYFLRLSNLLNLKIMRLGETAVPFDLLGCDLDEIMRPGFRFDLGGKTASGRKDDRSYSLIGKVQVISNYIRRDFFSDKGKINILPAILSSSRAMFADSDAELGNLYQESVKSVFSSPYIAKNPNRAREILAVRHEGLRNFGICRGLSLLKQGQDRYQPKLVYGEDEGKNFDTKEEIYRFPDRVINGLAVYNGVVGGMSGFARLAQLEEQGFLTLEQKEQLEIAYAVALEFRLRGYLEKGYQCEDMEIIKESGDENRYEKLFALYSRVIPLYREIDRLRDGEINNFASLETIFHEPSDKHKGLIHKKLEEYELAIHCFEKWKKEEKNIKGKAEAYRLLGEVKIKMGRYEEGLEDLKEARKKLEAKTHALEISEIQVFEAKVRLNNLGAEEESKYTALGLLLAAQEQLKEIVDHEGRLTARRQLLINEIKEIFIGLKIDPKSIEESQKEIGNKQAKKEDDFIALVKEWLARIANNKVIKFENIDLNNVPLPVRYFVGRDDELLKIKKALLERGKLAIIQSISGMGGIGKTQLVRKFAELCVEEYNLYGGGSRIIWLDAESSEILESSLLNYLEIKFNLYEKVLRDGYKEYLENICRKDISFVSYLSSELYERIESSAGAEKILIIYDNVEDYADISDSDPRLKGKRNYDILLTSRRQNIRDNLGEIESLVLDLFDASEAKEMISKRLGKNSRVTVVKEDVENLLRLLGEVVKDKDGKEDLYLLPLALNQALSYIEQSGMRDLCSYARKYEIRKQELLKNEGPRGTLYSLDSYKRTLFYTWHTSLAKIKNKYPEVESVLIACMVFSADKIVDAKRLKTYLPEDLSSIEEDYLCEILKVLSNYSILEVREEGYKIHRLQKEIITLYEKEEFKSLVKYHVQQSLLYPVADINSLGKEYMWELEEVGKDDAANYIKSTSLLSDIYIHRGDVEKARLLLEEALDEAKRIYGAESIQTADCIEKISFGYGYCGDYSEQIKYQKEALEIKIKNYGNQHVEVARILDGLGTAYGRLGDYKAQVSHQEEALKIKEELYGNQHVEFAITLSNLGSGYGYLRNYNKKVEYQEEALRIKKEEYGGKHIEVMRTLENLGNGYGALGQYDKQVEYQEEVLKVKRKVYGNKHAEVARTLSNLGVGYSYLKDYDRQVRYQTEALEIKKAVYGVKHVEFAITLSNLGSGYGSLGDYNKQVEYQEEALKIKRERYGDNHIEVASTLDTLGNAYGELGKYDKEIACQEEALKIKKAEHGPNHVESARTLCNLGSGHGHLGDYVKQLEYQEKALPIIKEFYGDGHLLVETVLKEIEQARIKLDNRDRLKVEPLPLLREQEGEVGEEESRQVMKPILDGYCQSRKRRSKKEESSILGNATCVSM